MQVTDDRWETIEEKAAAARRRRFGLMTGVSMVSVAAIVALVFGLAQVIDTDDGPQRVRVGGSPETTVTPTTTPTPTTAVAAVPSRAVWNETFADPETAAKEFATKYLGMTAPTVVAADGDAQYLVRAKSGRGPFTRVSTVFEGGKWVVSGAYSDNLQLESPAANALINSPVELRGRSLAYEAHVNVEVRQVNQIAGQSLASTFYTGGGGSGTVEPFRTTVTFRPSATPTGALVLLTYSAEDGSVMEATVVPIRFRA